MTMIEDIKRDRETGMPDFGGWSWVGGRDCLSLATRCGGRRYVMDFVRKGMRGAQPRFQTDGLMHKAIDHLTTYQVGEGTARGQKEADEDNTVYRMDISGVDHPDARRIARVPDMEAALIAAEKLAALAGEGECPWIEDTGNYREWWARRSEALAAYREATT